MKTNDLNQVKDYEPDSDFTTNKAKKSLKHAYLEWNEQLAENIINKWLVKYSSFPVTPFIFLEFIKGRKDSISIHFKGTISDADLVRIGFMLGLDYKEMNIVFREYRIEKNRADRLCSNYCPKTKRQFLNGSQIVKDLQNLLRELCVPYIYTAQTKEEKIRDTEIMIDDTQRYLDEIMLQASIFKTKINKLQTLREKIKSE